MVEAELERIEFVSLSQIQLRQLQQPRRYFNPEALEQLTASIRQHGILQPLLVRPVSGVRYELVAGERRFRAAQAVGLQTVPAVIRHLSEIEAATLALVENLQRQDLNAIEETEGILSVLALRLQLTPEATTSVLTRMAKEAKGQTAQKVLSQAEIETVTSVFDSLGRMSWESFVTSRLPLLNLPDDLQQAIQTQALDYTKAIALSRLKDDTQRAILLEYVLQQDWSVRRIIAQIRQLRHSQEDQAPGHEEAEPKRAPSQPSQQELHVLSDEEPLHRQLTLFNQIETLSKKASDLLQRRRSPISDTKKQSKLEALLAELNQILIEES